jgi:serine/threonine-protein kinase
VATAVKFNGDAALASRVILDQVGSSWLAVTLAPSPCKDTTSETWQVFTLQPQPDGSLRGDLIRLTSDQCQEK